MTDAAASARRRVQSLIRVRQVREFTDQPIDPNDLRAITEVARWSGSSRNTQPWRFIVIRDVEMIRHIAQAGMPQTRSLRTATAAIAVVLPDDPERASSHAFDEGRAAERMLAAASMLGLGAGIAWVRADVMPTVREFLGLPEDRRLRTIIALGHPTEAAQRPKSAPGEARLPRSTVIFDERWPPTRRGEGD